MKRLLTLAAFVSFFASSLAFAVKTGETAPQFTVTDINGRTHSLADFKGKYVVLEWFSQSCPFVRKFYNSGKMQELQKTMTGQDVVWLTIDSTSPGRRDSLDNASANALSTKWKMAQTGFILDPEGIVGKMYAAETTPHMFVINPEGMLIYQGAIDSIRSSDASDIAEATNYVTTAITSAKAGKPVSDPTTRPYGCGVKYAN